MTAIASIAFFYIVMPVTDMREKPTEQSEIVSQAYFSEDVSLLEDQGDWVKIKTNVDNYTGWVKKASLYAKSEKYPSKQAVAIAKINRLSAHIYAIDDTVFGPYLTLPYDSKLEIIDPNVNSNSRWVKVALPDGKQVFVQRGDIEINPNKLKQEDLVLFSKQFLNLPYTWGGRSSFGYDCSGFTQMLLRQIGIFCPRDSKDQVKWDGFEEIAMSDLKPTDFIYWGYDQNRIRHVGMYIGEGKFIHTSVRENLPYCRISNITDQEWNGQGFYPYFTARRLSVNNDSH